MQKLSRVVKCEIYLNFGKIYFMRALSLWIQKSKRRSDEWHVFTLSLKVKKWPIQKHFETWTVVCQTLISLSAIKLVVVNPKPPKTILTISVCLQRNLPMVLAQATLGRFLHLLPIYQLNWRFTNVRFIFLL